MTTTPTPAVVCDAVSFTWPDGSAALSDLDVVFPSGRTGLVGRNGEGKSTLLRLIAGRLAPTAGTITRSVEVGYLPQRIPSDGTVSDLLGITATRDALRAIEAGSTDPRHFELVADDWDVAARAIAALKRIGVLRDARDALDRPVGTLSGGEAVLAGVAGLLVRRCPISLLDEPSNNLDHRARGVLLDAIDAWPGVLIVAGHDRELLEHVDAIVELHDGRSRTFGGPRSFYEATLAAEHDTAQRLVRHAEGELAREKRQLVETQTKLARRKRVGDKASREKRVPKIIANDRKRTAQVSAAKYRAIQTGRADAARTALVDARDAVRDDDVIDVDLPGTELPAGRDVLRVGTLVVRGPERIALGGPNGGGKTTLLDAIARRRPHPSAEVEAPRVPTGYLRQDVATMLDDTADALANVRAAAPAASPQAVRAALARFLLRGDQVGRAVSTLSGGERLQVALATVLLADPAPQLLLLDEPTNDLDVASVRQLVSALRGYRGALLVVSHDEPFLADLGVTRRWQLPQLGLPHESRNLRYPT